MHAVAIFVERNIELPVQTILDAPVISQSFAETFGTRLLAGDEVAGLRARLSSNRAFAVAHADGAQICPLLSVSKAFGRVENDVGAELLSAVPAITLRVGVVLEVLEIGIERVLQLSLNVLQQPLLVALHGQHVVATLVDNLPSNCFLAAHRIDRHQGAGDVEHLQERRDRSDFVGFRIDGNLAERQVLGGSPGADQVQRPELRRSGTAERLAIDGDMLDVDRRCDRLNPRAETRLERLRLDSVENALVSVMGRDTLGQVQETPKPVAAPFAEGLDLLPVLCTRDDGAQGDDDDVLQRVDATVSSPGSLSFAKWWVIETSASCFGEPGETVAIVLLRERCCSGGILWAIP